MVLREDELKKFENQNDLHIKQQEKVLKEVAEKREHKHLTFSIKGDQPEFLTRTDTQLHVLAKFSIFCATL